MVRQYPDPFEREDLAAAARAAKHLDRNPMLERLTPREHSGMRDRPPHQLLAPTHTPTLRAPATPPPPETPPLWETRTLVDCGPPGAIPDQAVDYLALTFTLFEVPLQPKMFSTLTVQVYFLPFFNFATVNVLAVPLLCCFELPALHVALALSIGAPP